MKIINKERLAEGEISLYQLIPAVSMWADAFTKEMEIHFDMRELLMESNF